MSKQLTPYLLVKGGIIGGGYWGRGVVLLVWLVHVVYVVVLVRLAR